MEESAPETLWGFHIPQDIGPSALSDGYICLGWRGAGDITTLPDDREAFRDRLAQAYPDESKGTISIWAGILLRFAHQMREGDGIVYPSKHDRMINLGVIEGPCEYYPELEREEKLTRRKVRWIQNIPRTHFSETVLNTVGAIITLFRIENGAEEIRDAYSGTTGEAEPVDTQAAAAISESVEEATEDYIVRCLKTKISDYDFEKFAAMLMRAMGYNARVTQKSADGGVDVIAHRDELGFEPPIIKVQCKQVTGTIGTSDVQRLDGAVQQGEFGLFMTLGGYSAPARVYEQMNPRLRLLDGSDLAALVEKHYDALEPSAKRIIPLRRIYVPGPALSD